MRTPAGPPAHRPSLSLASRAGPAVAPQRAAPATLLAVAALLHLGLAVSLFVAPAARAAEVTDLPTRFRGDVHISYGGVFQQVGISEPDAIGADQTYAIRNTTRHDLGFRLEGAVWDGLAITVGLPVTLQQRIAWPAAREMLYEPNQGVGSYANGQAIDAEDIVTGGLQGVWFGAAVAPFSESSNTAASYRIPASARIDVGVRTPGAKSTMYGNGRGASPGGAAFRLAAAFSKRTKSANPYLLVDWVKEFKATIPQAVRNDGRVIATDLSVRGPDTLDVAAGSEIILRENPETQARSALWFEANLGYRGWQDGASGFYLPDVLEAPEGQTVTRQPYVQLGAGAGADVHVNRWVGFRLGVQGAWLTSHNVEHIYAARTDMGSWQVGWSLDLVGRIRTKDDPPTR